MTIKSILVASELIESTKANTTIDMPFGHAQVKKIVVVEKPTTKLTLASQLVRTFDPKKCAYGVLLTYTDGNGNKRKEPVDNAVDCEKSEDGWIIYDAKGNPLDLSGSIIADSDNIAIPMMSRKTYQAWVDGDKLYVTETELKKILASAHYETYAWFNPARRVLFTTSDKK
tara:strand:- start:1295 stop:1807 length:513 start_codon:yes stop_codon:yes gene_type:complete